MVNPPILQRINIILGISKCDSLILIFEVDIFHLPLESLANINIKLDYILLVETDNARCRNIILSKDTECISRALIYIIAAEHIYIC